MKNHNPTGMALMQDGTLNLTFVANALRFYANHIEGHPQRGDYFPADLRLAAEMLMAETPPPSTHMGVTDEQVERALITWFKNEVSWDKGMAPWSADQFRTEMRATLEAALATTEGQP